MTTTDDYKKENYDQILIRVKKGKREEYRLAAEEMGLGQMELFRRGVEEYIANHGGEMPASTPKPESISASDKRRLTKSTPRRWATPAKSKSKVEEKRPRRKNSTLPKFGRVFVWSDDET